MNKEAAGDDLGLTLQTGFVTKALVGLFGSDRFRLAVSADGSTFFDGLIVDNANGIVDQPRLPRFRAYANYDNHVGVGTWTKLGINNADYNDQGVFDSANNRFIAPRGRHLPARRVTPLQGQRLQDGPHARAARAERHDRNPRLLRRNWPEYLHSFADKIGPEPQMRRPGPSPRQITQGRGSNALAALAGEGRRPSRLASGEWHAVEADLPGARVQPGDGGPAAPVRAGSDRLAAEWQKIHPRSAR